LAAAYADDGVFVLPDGGVVKGRAAVRGIYAASEAGGGKITGGGIESQGLACGGPGLVYEWGRGTVRTLGADGRERERSGAYLTVWRRVGDAWKIVRNLAF
jgi:ketosteroid isomerase-like protein